MKVDKVLQFSNALFSVYIERSSFNGGDCGKQPGNYCICQLVDVFSTLAFAITSSAAAMFVYVDAKHGRVASLACRTSISCV